MYLLGILAAILAATIASFIDIRKKVPQERKRGPELSRPGPTTLTSTLDVNVSYPWQGEVIRHLLRPLTPLRIAMMDKDCDGEVGSPS
jgi:hypothetical protein